MAASSTNLAKNGNGRREIAKTTLEAIEAGAYTLQGVSYNLTDSIEHMKEHTVFYPENSPTLSAWKTPNPEQASTSLTKISILEGSTLEGTFQLAAGNESRVGVLNFASAKHEGGGFLTGAQAQEESLARSSTLYSSLKTPTAQQFYSIHKKDPKKGYYSHAMIYSPRVVIFRNDKGELRKPVEVDMLVSAAVNAGVVRRYLREAGSTDESDLRAAMVDRMGRILRLFSEHGVKDVVLGSFGTGVFRNSVEMVAEIWIDLLVVEGARFKNTFDRVVFAILDNPTYSTFKRVFESKGLPER